MIKQSFHAAQARSVIENRVGGTETLVVAQPFAGQWRRFPTRLATTSTAEIAHYRQTGRIISPRSEAIGRFFGERDRLLGHRIRCRGVRGDRACGRGRIRPTARDQTTKRLSPARVQPMRRRDGRITTFLPMPPVDLRAIGTDPPFVLILEDPSLLLVAMFERRLDVFVDRPLSVWPGHGQTHFAYRTSRWRVVRYQSPRIRLARRCIHVSRSASEGVREWTERSCDQHSRIRRCRERGRCRGSGNVHGRQSWRRKRPIVIMDATSGGDILNGMRFSIVNVAVRYGIGGVIYVRLRGGWPRERRDRIVLRHRPTSQFKMLGLIMRRCVHATLPSVLLLLLRLQLFFLLPVIREIDTVTDLCASFCSPSVTPTSASWPNSTRRRENSSRRSCSRSPCCFWRGW